MAGSPHAWVKKNLDLDPQAIDELQKRVGHQADAFLEMWLVAATGALQEMPSASDKSATYNFLIALGGNLLWAGTCLIAPEMVVAVRVCSFVGATLGTGTVTLPKDERSPIKDINTHLHSARDGMSKAAHAGAGKIAAAIVKQGRLDVEAQDQAIWAYLFGKLPYNSSGALLEKARSSLKQAYDGFESSYDSWLQVTQDQAEALNEKMPPPEVTDWELAKIGYISALQRRLPSVLTEVRTKHPFKLQLRF